jgi:hypothetical protein
LVSCHVEAKKEADNYIVVCGNPPVSISLAYQGPLLKGKIHTDARNPFVELQIPGDQIIVHYLSAGESCSVRKLPPEVKQEAGGRYTAPNA